jgi:hypothetical protein
VIFSLIIRREALEKSRLLGYTNLQLKYIIPKGERKIIKEFLW